MFRRLDDATRATRPAPLGPLGLGRYPTAIEPAAALSIPGAELWIKRDDRTHEVYGGNKVRKLEWLLADARARGTTRVITAGAVGSHHVLATSYFGRSQGLEVEAVLVPQPRTDHVVETIRAALALGLRATPLRWRSAAPLVAFARSLGRGRFIPIGGSSVVGSLGYVSAARELAAQVRAGEMPEPDLCVVALGSGGTAAGLAAGLAAEHLKTEVIGVCVAEPAWATRVLARALTRGCMARLCAEGLARADAEALRPHLSFDDRFLGAGYGHSTPAGDEATTIASRVGLELDPTYTAKAFAAALSHLRAAGESRARSSRPAVVLYWHTLSSAPLAPLLAGAPDESALDARVRGLLGSGAAYRGTGRPFAR